MTTNLYIKLKKWPGYLGFSGLGNPGFKSYHPGIIQISAKVIIYKKDKTALGN